MKTYTLIPAKEFCKSHKVSIETVQAFGDYGLIQVTKRKETLFIPEDQLKRLEQILVFKNDLAINLEGIETIFDLLERIETMQSHIIELENKLKRFL